MPPITAEQLAPEGLAVRHLTQLRAAADDDGARTFEGLAVPYGETYETSWFRERFEPGSVESADTALVFGGHRDPIGRVTATRDAEDGLHITGRISDTPTGREVHTLMRDGVLSSLSIGFEPIEWREEHDEDDDRPLIVHTRARAREFSVVAFPAYETAQLSAVRHRTPINPPSTTPEKENTMPPEAETITRADFDALHTTVTDLDRQLRAGAFTGTATRAPGIARAAQFATSGEWLQAIAQGEKNARHDEAMALYRDVTTAGIPTLSETPGWLGDYTQRVQNARKWINRFGGVRRALPAKGMTVDYVQRTRSATVAEQLAELDPLPKGTTRGLSTKSAPVRTFGGAETLSRQVIDRMDSWVITDMLEAMSDDYAAETDTAFRVHMIAAVQSNLDAHTATPSADHALDVPAEFSAFDWIDTVVDAGGLFSDRQLSLEALAVSKDVFKKLAHEAGLDGRPLMTTSGTGSNVVGTINAPAGSGELLRVPVDVLYGAEPNTALFYDVRALEYRESPGAPFQLQQDEVLNLSRDYALYGYAAMLTPRPDALVPVNFTAAGA